MKRNLAFAMTAGLLAFIAAPAMAQAARPAPGGSWQRATDWVPGSTHGSTMGNPSMAGGWPVWQYEWVNGGPLGSTNEWYTQPGHLMTWDSSWFGKEVGVWSRGDDTNPVITPTKLVHNMTAAYYDDIPLVRWLMPGGSTRVVHVLGDISIKWAATFDLPKVPGVDLVIAKQDNAGDVIPLFSTTFDKPTPGGIPEILTFPIELKTMMREGESLLFTHRAHSSSLRGRIALTDDLDIKWGLVPAPGTLVLVSLGGLVAARRHR